MKLAFCVCNQQRRQCLLYRCARVFRRACVSTRAFSTRENANDLAVRLFALKRFPRAKTPTPSPRCVSTPAFATGENANAFAAVLSTQCVSTRAFATGKNANAFAVRAFPKERFPQGKTHKTPSITGGDGLF
jgi:hypothetical protein